MKLPMKLAFVLITLALAGGCVSSKKYDESLARANYLSSENSALDSRISEIEGELSTENSLRSAYEKAVARLEDEKSALLRSNDTLTMANDELMRSIGELSQQRTTAFDEKSRAIEKLAQEKALAAKEKQRVIAELKGTYDDLVSELNEEIKQGQIAVTQLKNKLTLSLVEKILFDSGRADIKKNGKAVLDRVAEILSKVKDRQIRIEGHTDNVPIGSVLAMKFPTNWELSTARSTTVVRYLQEKGVDPSLLSAAGYSEYRPIEFNDTDEGRAKNRRIEIVLIPLDAPVLTD